MSDPPASSILDANLAALDAALAPLVRAGEGRWLLTASVEGPVLQLRTPTGALVAAHSRRGPEAEAARLVDEGLAGRPHPGAAIVIGAGLGYVIDELLARDAATRFLVLEPDPSGVAPWLARRDWREAIARGRLRVLTGPDYRGSEHAWRVVGTGEAVPLVIVHPVLAREYPDDVRRAGSLGARVIADARANAGAEAALAAPYLLNTIENLGLVAREADVAALAGAFTGVPAIVAAAGPSLDRVVEGIAAYAGRALVIAVDTALRPLLAHGVAPHFAVAVDPSERNARHLTALPAADATWLVAEPGVDPRAFAAFAGRTFTFRVGANPPWPWLEAHGITRGTLAAWGSVLVSAIDLAIRLGARPIEIVGADLAYTGGQPYCRGTAFEEDWATEVRWGSSLAAIWDRVAARPGAQTQPDADGRPVPTLPHLVAFRDRLLQQIRAAGDGIVNATGGGILHGAGVPVAPLGALVGLAPALPDLRPRIRDIHRRSASGARAPADALRTLLGRAGLPQELAAMAPGVDGDRVESSLARAREALAAPPIGTPLAPVGSAEDAVPVWLPEQTAALASLVDDAAFARAPLPADDGATMVKGHDAFQAVLDAAVALLAHPSLVSAPLDPAAIQRDLLALPLSMLLPLVHDARADADRFGAALTRWIVASRAAEPDGSPGVPVPRDAAGGNAAVTSRAADDLARLAIVTTVAWAAARHGKADTVTLRTAATLAGTIARATTRQPGARVRLSLDAGGDAWPWIDDAPLALLARALAGTLVRTAPDAEPAVAPEGPAIRLAGSLAIEAGGEWLSGVFVPWLSPVMVEDASDLALSPQASSGEWTAEALPDADVVRIARAGSPRGWIVCAGPRTVAWVDGALVVVADGAPAIRVPDVVNRLS